ncbi:MAG: GAF domain-containing protein, partial [Bacillota bacterium]|nr:GAF domain-containing protein [Bacillota bacterium]
MHEVQEGLSLVEEVDALLGEDDGWLPQLGNAAAALFHRLGDINWVGFYLRKGEELLLGPFQGKPACVRIAMGRGVCGTAALKKEILRVSNVHEFPGHIACDTASNSELVIPIMPQGEVVGVLDVDSPLFQRFGVEEERELAAVVQ